MVISKAIKIICEHTDYMINDIISLLVQDVGISKDLCEQEKGGDLPPAFTRLTKSIYRDRNSPKYDECTGEQYLENLIPQLSNEEKDNLCKVAKQLMINTSSKSNHGNQNINITNIDSTTSKYHEIKETRDWSKIVKWETLGFLGLIIIICIGYFGYNVNFTYENNSGVKTTLKLEKNNTPQ